jgi:Na+-driven multidrug efflux pump
VVRLTVVFINFLGAAQPLMAVDFALGGALRGAGDTRYPLFTTFTGLIIGRVLLATVFTHLDLPVEWIYGSLLADYVLKSSLLIVRFRSRKWQRTLAHGVRDVAILCVRMRTCAAARNAELRHDRSARNECLDA